MNATPRKQTVVNPMGNTPVQVQTKPVQTQPQPQQTQPAQPAGFTIEQVNLISSIVQQSVKAILDAQTSTQTTPSPEPIPEPIPVAQPAIETKIPVPDDLLSRAMTIAQTMGTTPTPETLAMLMSYMADKQPQPAVQPQPQYFFVSLTFNSDGDIVHAVRKSDTPTKSGLEFGPFKSLLDMFTRLETIATKFLSTINNRIMAEKTKVSG